MEFPFLAPTRKAAIAYYRHSAEDKQENSVAIQRDHAARFARIHDIEIIHEETDEGKSGLSANRAGFQNLFTNWILNDRAPPFEYVLVYDVSRWGRFQNPDEAAAYQYRCAQRGKTLIFIDRGMPRADQPLVTHLQTSIERYMAAEYSRQLSSKVFYGSAKVSADGFSAGGTASYGMSRILLDANKKPIRVLKSGEHKQISNERVTFIPSNDAETETVRNIFRHCAEQNKNPEEIAQLLNVQKIPAPRSGVWNRAKILRVLQNETYTGSRIYNKRWSRLKQKSRANPRSEWVTCDNAFPSVVSRETFNAVQKKLVRWQNAHQLRTQKEVSAMHRRVHTALRESFFPAHSSEDTVSYALQHFPIAFSVAQHGQKSWCFSISEEMKSFDYFFLVALYRKDTEPMHHVLCMPTSMFCDKHYGIISEDENIFTEGCVSEELLRERIHEIFQSLVKRSPYEHFPKEAQGANNLDSDVIHPK